MRVTHKYLGSSSVGQTDRGQSVLKLAPNLDRDRVAFEASLRDPVRFREAVSALHDVAVSGLKFQRRDRAGYREWKRRQQPDEQTVAQQARSEAERELSMIVGSTPARELNHQHQLAVERYWTARRQLDQHLRRNNRDLWRQLMPCDPVVTVAKDVVSFECFSADESSYGCLSIDRDGCFGRPNEVCEGTASVDYSWELYESFQTLRSYRENRFSIDPAGFESRTSDSGQIREEKTDLPDGWLRSFLQLQCATGLPMRKVSLGVECLYSILVYLKQHRARVSPRALRFELSDGQPPTVVVEPWERRIDSTSTRFSGEIQGQIRVWGRRRLLGLSRVLPLAKSVDVYLLGTGLPSFWVVNMGDMQLTLGLSGWTRNNCSRGSPVESLLPHQAPPVEFTAAVAAKVQQLRSASLPALSESVQATPGDTLAGLSQLALQGQLIFDIPRQAYRWRQFIPMVASETEVGAPHPEFAAAQQFLQQGIVKVRSQTPGPHGGTILAGTVGNQNCEVLVDDDAMIMKGRCRCSWHLKHGLRNGVCRHLQAVYGAVSDGECSTSSAAGPDDWYQRLVKQAGVLP